MITATDQLLVEDYLHWVGTTNRRSKSTVRCYANVLKSYLEWLEGRPLSTVEIADVEAFGAREGRKKLKPNAAAMASTVRKDVVIIRQFHRWASERHADIRRIDTVAVPRLPYGQPKPIDDDVWRRLWGSDLSREDRLWLGLGYFCGLRRVEMVTLRPSDVNITEGVMLFKRKGGGMYPIEYRGMINIIDQELPQLTMGRAQEWLEILTEVVIERTMLGADYLWYDSEGHEENDGNRLNKRVDKRLAPQLGLAPHSVTPHRLRHSCATNLLRAGLPAEFVQKALSHSSVDITHRYMKMSGEMARWWAREKGKDI